MAGGRAGSNFPAVVFAFSVLLGEHVIPVDDITDFDIFTIRQPTEISFKIWGEHFDNGALSTIPNLNNISAG